MQTGLLVELRAREAEIHGRWAELLRIEPVNTPLAHPDALAHLIEWTLADIFRELALGHRRQHSHHSHKVASNRSLCLCGRNPLLAYFDAAGQALREALVLAQAAQPGLDPVERDASLDELNLILDEVARREIEAFCGVCQYRQKTGEPTQCPAVVAHA